MALGTPVVALGEGGVLDSVLPGATGIFFPRPEVESLRAALDEVEGRRWDRETIRAHARTFSRARFDARFQEAAVGAASRLMIEKKHRTLASVYLVNDALASNLAMLCAWFLRFQFELIPVTKGQQGFGTYVALLPLITVVFPRSRSPCRGSTAFARRAEKQKNGSGW